MTLGIVPGPGLRRHRRRPCATRRTEPRIAQVHGGGRAEILLALGAAQV